ncbi:hypothetical protein DRO66_05090 [Candidatus Bathyarchaeota archaeon]|nr:MAG: hypothetical protein DRO66_05090 [Candidatus Bathyarchaeota archaeon]
MSYSSFRNYRLVKLIYPRKSKDGNLTYISSFKVHFKKKSDTIYDTVEQFEKELGSKIKETIKEIKKPVLLRDIINLHNINGIKSINQIRTMVKKIKSGKDILSPSELPNIKLVKTQKSEWILFDGHHSLLSYMIAGRTHLHEIPYLVIEDEKGYVNDKEILVFFGMHSIQLTDSNWKKYVINWQAPKERQLCKREQNNMGELLDSISSFYKV